LYRPGRDIVSSRQGEFGVIYIMNVALFGATGMIGQGVLRECLLDAGVTRVVTVGRSATGVTHPKLHEIVHAISGTTRQSKPSSQASMPASSAWASPRPG